MMDRWCGYASRGFHIRLCCLAVLVFSGSVTSTAKVRPNVVLVMADDQGWGDTGYNGHPFVQTPAMDAMAEAGFVFDRFYAGGPVCSPTRASVMSGRHPFRSRTTNHGRYMRPQEQTMPETLRANGYRTGIFGKFHLGSGQPGSPCNPGAMGFDEWVIGLNFFDNDPYLSRSGKVEHRKGKGSVILMDDAIRFIREHQNGEQPIFTVIWFPSPHVPHAEVPDGPDHYEDKPNAGYWREIELLDQQLARLRSVLRELKIADNTILWYCSDNGGLIEASSGGRNKKGSIYEGGLRVPAMVEWPSAKLKGRSAVPVSTSDMYPTIMTMLGIKLDESHPPLDGIDVSGVFSGKMTSRSNPIGFWHKIEGGQATRSDDLLKDIMLKQQSGAKTPHNEWRMTKDVYDLPTMPESTAKGHAALNDWPWKLHRINGKAYELYNLEDDPMEAKDLSRDPGQAERLSRMQTDLQAWMRSVIESLNGGDYRAR